MRAIKKIFQKISQNEFISYFLTFYQGADADLSSIAVAYYLLVAVFPLFFLLSALLPYLQINISDILSFLESSLPPEIYHYVSGIVRKILTTPSSGWLGISILTTLWTFSQSMLILSKAFNKAYGVEDHRDLIVGRLIGLLVGLVLQIALFLLVSVGMFGETIVNLLDQLIDLDREAVNRVLSWTQPVVYLGFALVIMFLYYALPNVRIKKLRYILPGTAFIIFVMTLTTNLVSLYLNQYMDKFESFQLVSYVVLLAIMLWFIFIAQLLIIGAVLNASYQAKAEGGADFRLRRGTVAEVLDKFRSGSSTKQVSESKDETGKEVD